MVFVPVIFNVAFACVAAADLVAAVLSKMMKQTQAVSMAGLMTVNADVVVFLEAARQGFSLWGDSCLSTKLVTIDSCAMAKLRLQTHDLYVVATTVTHVNA